MKTRHLLLALALVSGLFSTSFASTGTAATEKLEYNPEGSSNPNGLGMAGQPGYSQGAPESDLVYCNKCGGWVHRSQVRIADATAAYRSSTPVNNGGGGTSDDGRQ